MVTHNHDLVKFYGGRVINLREGSVAYDGIIESAIEGE